MWVFILLRMWNNHTLPQWVHRKSNQSPATRTSGARKSSASTHTRSQQIKSLRAASDLPRRFQLLRNKQKPRENTHEIWYLFGDSCRIQSMESWKGRCLPRDGAVINQNSQKPPESIPVKDKGPHR
jgi:hypothetical protein